MTENAGDSKNSDSIIKLNIGGTVFQTTKSTLTRFDGFFKTMLETDVPITKDQSGYIFIDRDSKHFRLILNYMRDGFVNIPESKSDIQEIQIEAQYYLLNGLVKLCNSQRSVNNEVKEHCLKTQKDVINAVLNSTKKAVILVVYEIGSEFHKVGNIFQKSAILKKYSADFDVYFYPSEPRIGMDYRVCDMSTGKYSYVPSDRLDIFLKDNYGVE